MAAAAAARVALAAVTDPPAPAPRGDSHRTPEWSTLEASILKPDVLSRDLNLAEQQLTAEAQAVLNRIDLFLAHMVEAIAAEGQQYLSENVKRLVVPESLHAELREVLAGAAARMREYGARAVANEASRQVRPDVAGPNRESYMSPYPTFYTQKRRDEAFALGVWERIKRGVLDVLGIKDRAPKNQPLSAELAAQDRAISAEIDTVVAAEIGRREASATNAALDALAQAPIASASELAQLAGARAAGALEELSTYRTQDEVGSVVSTSFGSGRLEGLNLVRASYGDRVKALVYSAVMDGGTCPECAKWDGAQFPPDYDQTPPGNVKAPNPNCAGSRKRCRCVWVAILSDEADVVDTETGTVTVAATDKSVSIKQNPEERPRRGRRLRDIHIHDAPAAPNVTVNNEAPGAPTFNLAMPPIQLHLTIDTVDPRSGEKVSSSTRTFEMRDETGAVIRTGTVKQEG